MAFRYQSFLRVTRGMNKNRLNVCYTPISSQPERKDDKVKDFRTEDNFAYYGDPDKFGTLSRKANTDKVVLEDEGDVKEENFTTYLPLPSQKLTTRQYADLIKQYIKQKRLKEAINVLEVRILQEDRVKPENYIYNILIGACAEVGYTKKAFQLFNEMKKRALTPTGDTYTCLFHACSNSPWASNGLKHATHLRELMIEKGIKPNVTNYNAMIKAFGRCGDVHAAFTIADEMVSKGIKIRVHTFNHLLQACISDKNNGLRHAIIVWRKMLKSREKPNIYSFNLMLKCVKECNLGSQADIEELAGALREQMSFNNKTETLQIESPKELIESKEKETDISEHPSTVIQNYNTSLDECKKMSIVDASENITMQLVALSNKDKERTTPNLLSKVIQMQEVLSLQQVNTLQEKFAVIGGQEDFLKEMEAYSVKPDVKTFTQMLPLLEDTVEAEHKLLSTLKALNVRVDIDFYNMLIKKRCLRLDYDGAFEVMKIIVREGKISIKRFPDRKKLHVKPNIMTYGVLAMACKSKENAEKLLNDMKEARLKVNIEILGTLLRHGTAHTDFGYVLFIINVVKSENLPPNPTFLKHLEAFNDKCKNLIHREKNRPKSNEVFLKTCQIFSMAYNNWLKEINIDEVLKPEQPWAQFNETYPETVQKPYITINQPKKFYKRSRKYVKYRPSIV